MHNLMKLKHASVLWLLTLFICTFMAPGCHKSPQPDIYGSWKITFYGGIAGDIPLTIQKLPYRGDGHLLVTNQGGATPYDLDIAVNEAGAVMMEVKSADTQFGTIEGHLTTEGEGGGQYQIDYYLNEQPYSLHGTWKAVQE